MALVEAKNRSSAAEAGGGNVGISDRSFTRWYQNWEGPPMQNAGTFINAFSDLRGSYGEDPRQRHVLRSLMTPSAIHELAEQRGRLHGTIEFALPVKVSGSEMFLVGAAANGPQRESRDPYEIKNDVLAYQTSPKTLEQHVQHVFDKKYSIITTIDENNDRLVGDLATMWGYTFGNWNAQGVKKLARDLAEQTAPDYLKDQRTVVFTGILDEKGRLVAATTAGALELQTFQPENPFTVWESTEWVSRPDIAIKEWLPQPKKKVKGMVAAAAAITNAQIIDAYEGKRDYTILAEGNTSTPALSVAMKAGMEMPKVISGDYVHPQVMTQNVGVNDGKYATSFMVNDGRVFPLRDFGVVQLPQHAIDLLYRPYMAGLN